MTQSGILPDDAAKAHLVGRAWLGGAQGGPSVVLLRGDDVIDITDLAPTSSALCNMDDPVALLDKAKDRPAAASLAALPTDGEGSTDRLLSPVDLQAHKASGVTFTISLIERLIEEQAGGDLSRADEIRLRLNEDIGADITRIKPGSNEALALRETLTARGAWSQYLEVGLGPDAEIFTKCQPLASVGTGARIGIQRTSHWNNPEPEMVLVVSRSGRIVGATLGNDVNHRDVEGRSALLLGRAKDNNASCALGPFIRLFDGKFSLDDVRNGDVALKVDGTDGFVLEDSGSMTTISRDPADLVGQALNAEHPYPDGLILMLGSLSAPTKDRGAAGMGFTHRPGDTVRISNSQLGVLQNTVQYADEIPAWSFGVGDLFRNLARRGMLKT